MKIVFTYLVSQFPLRLLHILLRKIFVHQVQDGGVVLRILLREPAPHPLCPLKPL